MVWLIIFTDISIFVIASILPLFLHIETVPNSSLSILSSCGSYHSSDQVLVDSCAYWMEGIFLVSAYWMEGTFLVSAYWMEGIFLVRFVGKMESHLRYCDIY